MGQATVARQARPWQRLAGAVAGIGHRLRRRAEPTGPVWSRELTVAVLLAFAAILAAAIGDGAAISFARTSDWALLRWMEAITDIGKSQWYLVPAALVFLAVGAADWSRLQASGRQRYALIFGQAGFAFAAIALSGILVNVLKVMVGRARPILFDQHGPYHFEPFTPGYAFASFPSGHSTTVGALTGILVLWYPRYAAAILPLGLFLAATRIAADAHYPSDVVAGFAFGLMVTVVMARVLASRGAVFRFQPGKILPSVIGIAPRI